MEKGSGGMEPNTFYDDIWVAWRDMQRYAPAPRYLRRMVLRELGRLQFSSVIDVGCGEGSLLRMIRDRYPGLTLAGSELSRTALQYSREQLPNADLMIWNIEADSPPLSAYDLVVSVQVLEHLKDDLGALQKLRRIFRKYIIISVPGGKLDERGRRNGHYRHYTRQGLVETMERAGFTVIRSFTCGWPVHSFLYRQLVRHLPQRSIEATGLGSYTLMKRAVMQVGDWAYRLNLPFIGTEVFAVGSPRE